MTKHGHFKHKGFDVSWKLDTFDDLVTWKASHKHVRLGDSEGGELGKSSRDISSGIKYMLDEYRRGVRREDIILWESEALKSAGSVLEGR